MEERRAKDAELYSGSSCPLFPSNPFLTLLFSTFLFLFSLFFSASVVCFTTYPLFLRRSFLFPHPFPLSRSSLFHLSFSFDSRKRVLKRSIAESASFSAGMRVGETREEEDETIVGRSGGRFVRCLHCMSSCLGEWLTDFAGGIYYFCLRLVAGALNRSRRWSPTSRLSAARNNCGSI